MIFMKNKKLIQVLLSFMFILPVNACSGGFSTNMEYQFDFTSVLPIEDNVYDINTSLCEYEGINSDINTTYLSSIYHNLGTAIYENDGLFGVYSLYTNKLLIPTEYDSMILKTIPLKYYGYLDGLLSSYTFTFNAFLGFKKSDGNNQIYLFSDKGEVLNTYNLYHDGYEDLYFYQEEVYESSVSEKTLKMYFKLYLKTTNYNFSFDFAYQLEKNDENTFIINPLDMPSINDISGMPIDLVGNDVISLDKGYGLNRHNYLVLISGEESIKYRCFDQEYLLLWECSIPNRYIEIARGQGYVTFIDMLEIPNTSNEYDFRSGDKTYRLKYYRLSLSTGTLTPFDLDYVIDKTSLIRLVDKENNQAIGSLLKGYHLDDKFISTSFHYLIMDGSGVIKYDVTNSMNVLPIGSMSKINDNLYVVNNILVDKYLHKIINSDFIKVVYVDTNEKVIALKDTSNNNLIFCDYEGKVIYNSKGLYKATYVNSIDKGVYIVKNSNDDAYTLIDKKGRKIGHEFVDIIDLTNLNQSGYVIATPYNSDKSSYFVINSNGLATRLCSKNELKVASSGNLYSVLTGYETSTKLYSYKIINLKGDTLYEFTSLNSNYSLTSISVKPEQYLSTYKVIICQVQEDTASGSTTKYLRFVL